MHQTLTRERFLVKSKHEHYSLYLHSEGKAVSSILVLWQSSWAKFKVFYMHCFENYHSSCVLVLVFQTKLITVTILIFHQNVDICEQILFAYTEGENVFIFQFSNIPPRYVTPVEAVLILGRCV